MGDPFVLGLFEYLMGAGYKEEEARQDRERLERSQEELVRRYAAPGLIPEKPPVSSTPPGPAPAAPVAGATVPAPAAPLDEISLSFDPQPPQHDPTDVVATLTAPPSPGDASSNTQLTSPQTGTDVNVTLSEQGSGIGAEPPTDVSVTTPLAPAAAAPAEPAASASPDAGEWVPAAPAGALPMAPLVTLPDAIAQGLVSVQVQGVGAGVTSGVILHVSPGPGGSGETLNLVAPRGMQMLPNGPRLQVMVGTADTPITVGPAHPTVSVVVPTVCASPFAFYPPPTDGSVRYEIPVELSPVVDVLNVVDKHTDELLPLANTVGLPIGPFKEGVTQYTIWSLPWYPSLVPSDGRTENLFVTGPGEVTIVDSPSDELSFIREKPSSAPMQDTFFAERQSFVWTPSGGPTTFQSDVTSPTTFQPDAKSAPERPTFRGEGNVVDFSNAPADEPLVLVHNSLHVTVPGVHTPFQFPLTITPAVQPPLITGTGTDPFVPRLILDSNVLRITEPSSGATSEVPLTIKFIDGSSRISIPGAGTTQETPAGEPGAWTVEIRNHVLHMSGFAHSEPTSFSRPLTIDWTNDPPEIPPTTGPLKLTLQGNEIRITVPAGDATIIAPLTIEPHPDQFAPSTGSTSAPPVQPESAGTPTVFDQDKIYQILLPQLSQNGATPDQVNTIATTFWSGVNLTWKNLNQEAPGAAGAVVAAGLPPTSDAAQPSGNPVVR